jgi:hypothetical protein
VNNQCFKLDNPTMACSQTCAPGYLLVFTDGQNVFNLCDPLEEANCQCEALPPILSNDLARFSSAGTLGSSILVSAYDGQFGDLVLHTFDKATLKEKSVEWVDGVPSTGTITGDPNGPRGGRADDGPDVGRYTSIATDNTNNITHIAYFSYATSGSQDTMQGTMLTQDLKYATRSGTGAWTTFVVDGSDAAGNDTGAVGMYTSITLAPDGAPVIAYFQSQGVGANATVSAIKVARGKIPQPQKATDFTISTIETEAIPATSGGADGGIPDGGSTAAKGPIELPPGDGLFTGISYINNVPVVVWYDRTLGQLKGIIAKNDSAPQGAQFVPSDIKVLDDGTMNTPASSVTHDVGRFASIAIGPSSAPHRIAVAYMDETSYQLKLITADAAWANLKSTVVDTGKGTPTGDTVLFVGSDTSVSFLNGLISIAYQDQTTGALRLATQETPASPVAYKATLDQDGAGGFYARLVNDGTNMFVTHAVIKANLNQTTIVSGNQLRALKVQ